MMLIISVTSVRLRSCDSWPTTFKGELGITRHMNRSTRIVQDTATRKKLQIAFTTSASLQDGIKVEWIGAVGFEGVSGVCLDAHVNGLTAHRNVDLTIG